MNVGTRRDLGVLAQEHQKVCMAVVWVIWKISGLLARLVRSIDFKSREFLLQLWQCLGEIVPGTMHAHRASTFGPGMQAYVR